jgi:hypothetical protein
MAGSRTTSILTRAELNCQSRIFQPPSASPEEEVQLLRAERGIESRLSGRFLPKASSPTLLCPSPHAREQLG